MEEATVRSRRKSSRASTKPPRTPTQGKGTRTPRSSQKGGDESDVDSQVSRGSGSTGTRQRLPLWIEKQLAEDIEAQGGIFGFDTGKAQGLSELCDYRSQDLGQPEFYGHRGSDQRRKISQKITKWKRLDQGQYLEKLSVLGVTPFKLRKTKEKGRRKKGLVPAHEKEPKELKLPETIEAKEGDDISLDLSLDLSQLTIEEGSTVTSTKSSASLKPKEKTKGKTKDTTPKSRNQVEKQQSLPTEPKRNLDFTMMATKSTPRVINIDTTYPGDQGDGVFAFRISTLQHGGVEWREGIELEMLVDPRDVQQELYKIEYIEGSNEATLYKPVLPAPFRDDASEFDARQAVKEIQTGHRAARTVYERLPPEQRYRKVTLRFGHGVKLTEAPFGVTGSAGEGTDTADLKMILYRKATGQKDKTNNDIFALHARLSWKFGDQSKKAVLDGAGNRGAKAADDAFGDFVKDMSAAISGGTSVGTVTTTGATTSTGTDTSGGGGGKNPVVLIPKAPTHQPTPGGLILPSPPTHKPSGDPVAANFGLGKNNAASKSDDPFDLEATRKAKFKKTVDGENRKSSLQDRQQKSRANAINRARTQGVVGDKTVEMIDTLMEEFDGDVAEQHRVLGAEGVVSEGIPPTLPPLPDDDFNDLLLEDPEQEEEYFDYDQDSIESLDDE
ncbi:hypothetical protein SEMRO_3138_G344360.1 [Seminavis robusta]|uniref:Uncharacterized protein n=1 Tax=Seminavis robusta TaxID=568900 RepID=A0A9N8F1J0_9STRA|nr:hypothetical protein SEMRO_3138_G344360.1 [Seminavis robusta]|eukprot:Sro3138_g344360.1 n/a (670) ;mRNA; f:2846-5026